MARWRELERRPPNEVHFLRFDRPENRWPEGPNGPQRDPFMSAGSHPDCVSQVWEQLGGTLPEDCRFLLLGRPVLAHPRSGFVFAMPMGTAYTLWIPKGAYAAAWEAGLRPLMKWGAARVTDLREEFGEGWLFGKYLPLETAWLAAAYAAAGLPG